MAINEDDQREKKFGSETVNDLVGEPQVGSDSVLPMSLNSLDHVVQSKAVAPRRIGAALPFEMMLDVPITLVFEVGRTDITIKQLMELCEGSYIELRHISVDSIDVRINENIIAEGETIALQQRYGVRFGEVAMLSNSESSTESAS